MSGSALRMATCVLVASTAGIACGCTPRTNEAVESHNGWLATFGGAGYDDATSVAERRDGTLVVVGGQATTGDDGNGELWVLTLDPDGAVRRRVTFGGSGDDSAQGVAATDDGGVVVIGSCDSADGDIQGHHGDESVSDACVLKLSADGAVEWTRSIGGTMADTGRSVIQTTDGHFLVGGDSFSADGDLAPEGDAVGHYGCAGTRDFMVARLSPTGTLEWARAFGGTNHDYLSQVIERRDGTFIAVGRTQSFDGDVETYMGEYDAWIVAFDNEGRRLWQKTIGGRMWDWGSSVTETADGGLAFAGYTYSWDGDGLGNHGDYDYVVVRMDALGNTLWSRVYGGLVDEFAQGIIELDDGSFVITGNTASKDGDITENRGSFDLWTIHISADGELLKQRSMGGSDYDIPGLGATLLQSADGDIVVVGGTQSADGHFAGTQGDSDAFVMKFDVEHLGVGGSAMASARPAQSRQTITADAPAGNPPAIEWQRTLGGSDADRVLDAPQAIAALEGGGYAFVGESRSSDGDISTANRGDNDIWVVRVDEDGDIVWDRSFGGTAYDYGAAIAEVADGLVFTGTVASTEGDMSGNHGMSDIFVAKLSADGDTIWTRLLGGSAAEFATTVAATPDGGVIVGGHTHSGDGDVSLHICAYDYWLVKLDADGEIVWERAYGGTSNDYLIHVITTNDGGYAAIGRTQSSDDFVGSSNGMYDYWLIKLDAAGEKQWQRLYGDWNWEWGNALVELADGGFVLSGYTYTFDNFGSGDVSSNHGEFDYWVVRVDDRGDLIWERSLGGSNYELGYGVAATSEGEFVVVGGSPSTDGQVTGNHGNWDVWMAALGADGDLRWTRSLGGSEYDAAYAVLETDDRGLIVIGETYSNDGDVSGLHGDGDVWLFKLAPRAE